MLFKRLVGWRNKEKKQRIFFTGKAGRTGKMIKKILERLLIKKMGYIPYEIYLKQLEIIYNQKNEINNLKKRLKYATEKKYL